MMNKRGSNAHNKSCKYANSMILLGVNLDTGKYCLKFCSTHKFVYLFINIWTETRLGVKIE